MAYNNILSNKNILLLQGDNTPLLESLTAPAGSLYINIGEGTLWIQGTGGTAGSWKEIVTGNYLPLTGGTMSGDINLNGNTLNVADGTVKFLSSYLRGFSGPITEYKLAANGIGGTVAVLGDVQNVLGGATSHNTLPGLQGGTIGKYYHSDQSINISDNVVFNSIVVGGTISGLTGLGSTNMAFLGNYGSYFVNIMYDIRNSSNGPNTVLLKRRGATGSPLTNDTLGNFRASGWQGSSYRMENIAGLKIQADSDWSETNAASKVSIMVVPTGSTQVSTAVEFRQNSVADFNNVIIVKSNDENLQPAEPGMIRYTGGFSTGGTFQGYNGSWIDFHGAVWSVVSVTGPTYTASNGEYVLVKGETCTVTLPASILNHRVGVKAASATVSSINVKTDAPGVTIDLVDRGTTGMPILNSMESYIFLADGASGWWIEK